MPIEGLPLRTALKLVPLIGTSAIVLAKLRERAERASARRLGVRPETAPRMRSQAGSWLMLFPVSLVWRRIFGPGRADWTVSAAAAAARRLRLRRSWQRAYAEAAGRR
jgi:hypothetical protein